MLSTLTISSQGQITIPKAIRDLWGIGTKSKVLAYVKKITSGYHLILEPKPKSWSKKLAGTGKGIWGNSDKYLQKERTSWQ